METNLTSTWFHDKKMKNRCSFFFHPSFCLIFLTALLLAPLHAAEPSASIQPVKWSADGRRMQIMPMGDSITQGTGTGNCGYRNALYQLLKNSGCVFDFVGRKNVPGDITPDTDHWGRAGWQMSGTPGTVGGKSYVSLQGENRSGLFEEMKDAISPAYFSSSADVRNVVLLMIGVNDLLHQVVESTRGRFNSDTNKDGQGDGQDAIADGLIARLQALLADINMRAAKHNLRIEVMVGTIPKLSKKWKGDAVSDVIVNQGLQYNQWIRTQLPAATFSHLTVKVVDMEGPLNGKLADGVHPNAEGYESMAHAWYEAITGAANLPTALPSASIQPVKLCSEYLTNPSGIDVRQPRLSWVLESRDPGARSLRQTAYQVLVSSSAELLARNTGDVWDSGKVISDENVGIVYAGRALRSRDECHWKARVWDQGGKVSNWSADNWGGPRFRTSRSLK